MLNTGAQIVSCIIIFMSMYDHVHNVVTLSSRPLCPDAPMLKTPPVPVKLQISHTAIPTATAVRTAHKPTHECTPPALCKLVCPILTLIIPNPPAPVSRLPRPGLNGASIMGLARPEPRLGVLGTPEAEAVREVGPLIILSTPPAPNPPEPPLDPDPPAGPEVRPRPDGPPPPMSGRYASALHSYHTLSLRPSHNLHIPTSSSDPEGR